ncbi:MAG: PKD domain-containing protein [Candidatus Peribacteria bacterium]|nr:PKD domain-containing protein [Candidatus Peribacteria bacterium]
MNFTGEDSLGKVSSYFWDFGNGETSTKSNPTSMIYEE